MRVFNQFGQFHWLESSLERSSDTLFLCNIRTHIFMPRVDIHIFCRLQAESVLVYSLRLQSSGNICIYMVLTRNNYLVSVSCYIAQLLLQFIITSCVVFVVLLANL